MYKLLFINFEGSKDDKAKGKHGKRSEERSYFV